MLTVSISINGNAIYTRTAVNTGLKEDGCTVYAVDDGTTMKHDPEEGAVKLAQELLKTIHEAK